MFALPRQRRFSRWLHNPRINVQKIYSLIIQSALSQWGGPELYLSLDTTMLWNEFCIMSICVVYRGRAVPVGWRVLAHPSSSVKFETYKILLNSVARILAKKVVHCIACRPWVC